MRIQHNLSAMNAHRQLMGNNDKVSKNLEKLSSGYRINRAGDDAAGLAISEKMRAQINGLDMASKNASDGISAIQTAEGGLQETHAILQRMREIAEQSSNGIYDDAVDRANIQKEFTALNSEVDRIAKSTKFNGKSLLDGSLTAKSTLNGQIGTVDAAFSGSSALSITFADGKAATAGTIGVVFAANAVTVTLGTNSAGQSFSADQITKAIQEAAQSDINTNGPTGNGAAFTDFSVSFSGTITGDSTTGIAQASQTTGAVDPTKGVLNLQIGTSDIASDRVSVEVKDMSATGLGIKTLKIDSEIDAKAALGTLDTAINTVSGTRADLGALQNRLEHTINNLGVASENLSAAESRIRDVDMAKEMMNMTKNNILTQAAQAMLAQANQQPQGVLQLLR